MDPGSFIPVTLEMDYDFLSEPEETVTIESHQFDMEAARFLCNLDIEVLTGRDRDFDTLEYAIFAARNARSDVLYHPEDYTAIDTATNSLEDTSVDSDATVPTSNVSTPSISKEAVPENIKPPDPGEPTTVPPDDDFDNVHDENLSDPVHYKRVRATHKTDNPESLRKY